MTEPPQNQATDAPAAPGSGPGQALTAFLRGIERRGAFFAELMSGDPHAGEQAFAMALRHFRDHALAQPFAQWPRLFWRTLLASPLLRGTLPTARWDAPVFQPLESMGSGPRAALLLRLVAGLGDADAAAVLGVAQPTYRLALRRALPHRDDGSADPAAWRALADAVQEAIRGLPAERLAHLARLRQAAVQGRRPELIGPAPPITPAHKAPVPGVRMRRVLWVGVAACALALLATFVVPLFWLDWGGGVGEPRIQARALGAAAKPASRYDAALALITERDFNLLAAAPAPPPLDDPAFYAWFAARQAGQGKPTDPGAGMREPMDTAAQAPESAQPESIDAP